MERTNKTTTLVYNAFIMAIIILMSAVPSIGFIQIPPIAITLVHIPVIIGAILFGFKAALLFSLTFGVSSLLVALTRGAATDVLFINPLVSVLPRLIFGIIIVVLYMALSKIKMKEQARIGITAFLSSFAHSIIVLTAIFISLGIQNPAEGNAIFRNVLAAVFTVNVTLEAVVATVVSIPVIMASRKVLKDKIR